MSALVANSTLLLGYRSVVKSRKEPLEWKKKVAYKIQQTWCTTCNSYFISIMASCPASTAENGCLSEVKEKEFKKSLI